MPVVGMPPRTVIAGILLHMARGGSGGTVSSISERWVGKAGSKQEREVGLETR